MYGVTKLGLDLESHLHRRSDEAGKDARHIDRVMHIRARGTQLQFLNDKGVTIGWLSVK